MKIDSNDLFKCFDGDEPEQLPMLTDTEKERIYRMSENKFKNTDINEKKDNGTTVSGVEHYSRPVWKKRLSAVAAAAVILLGAGGGAFILKNGSFAGTEKTLQGSDVSDTTEEVTTESVTETTDISEETETMELAKLYSDTYLEFQRLIRFRDFDRNDLITVGSTEKVYAKVTKPDFTAPADKIWTARTFEELKEYSLMGSDLFESEYGSFLNVRIEDLSEDISSETGDMPYFVEYNNAIYGDLDLSERSDIDDAGTFVDEPEIIAKYEYEMVFNRKLSYSNKEDAILQFALKKCDDGVWRIFGVGELEEGDDTHSELTQETAEIIYTRYNRIAAALGSPEYVDTDRSVTYKAILGSNKEELLLGYAPFTHPDFHSGAQFEQDVLQTFSESLRDCIFPVNIYSDKDYAEYPDGHIWTDNEGQNSMDLLGSPIGKIFIVRDGEMYRSDEYDFLPYYVNDIEPDITILEQDENTAEIQVKNAASDELHPYDVKMKLVWEGGGWQVDELIYPGHEEGLRGNA